jgi:YkoY family integral membrane protein
LDVQSEDLVTVALLVALEGLLSADNALVMAIMVLGLPKDAHRGALRYGLVGGFAFRIVATLLASSLIRVGWFRLAGGLYLLYLTFTHFRGGHGTDDRRQVPAAKGWLGLSPLWATVARVELINLAFSIDSILVAVAMSPKVWVVITGGVLGIIAMRLVVGQLLGLVERYPSLVDGAFVIIGWVGLKLGWEYLNQAGFVHFEIPHWFSLTLIGFIFAASFVYARLQGPAQATDVGGRAGAVLDAETPALEPTDRPVHK